MVSYGRSTVCIEMYQRQRREVKEGEEIERNISVVLLGCCCQCCLVACLICFGKGECLVLED